MATKNDKANLPLPTFWKIVAFLFPLLTFMHTPYIFSKDTYKRRYEESLHWTLIGAFFWILMISIVLGFMSFSS